MADSHHDDSNGSNLFQIYMIVAGVLAVCTALSFIVNQTVTAVVVAFLIILSVAIVKATLVALYFMHLKWDWRLLYFLIVPAFILGAMMMVVLMPDILIAPRLEATEEMKVSHQLDEAAFKKSK